MFEGIRENPVRYIKNFAMDIVVVIVGAAYVFYQALTFTTTSVNPLILIAEAFIGIVCGITIKQALGENGFSRGYNSKIWHDEEEMYVEACNSALPNMAKVDNFYRTEEIERRRNYRREHLQSKMLRYEDWFDFDGNFIGTKEALMKLTRSQRRMVNKCVKVKIYIPNMFSESGTATESDTKRESTDNTQRRKNFSKNTLSAVIIAMIGVYFVPILNEWNWASVIASTMQVALWVLFGILQLYSNYDFVVQEKVGNLRTKKELIKKFNTGCGEGKYEKNPYDIHEIKYPVANNIA